MLFYEKKKKKKQMEGLLTFLIFGDVRTNIVVFIARVSGCCFLASIYIVVIVHDDGSVTSTLSFLFYSVSLKLCFKILKLCLSIYL